MEPINGVRPSAWSSFYSSLFSAEPTDSGEKDHLQDHQQYHLLTRYESTLPAVASSSCCIMLILLLTKDELLAAVRGMGRGKAPRLDDLPLEFYLSFWHLLALDLLSALNVSFRDGHFPISLRSGVIMFKKGLNPANWRPITLLNVHYKICARAFAAVS